MTIYSKEIDTRPMQIFFSQLQSTPAVTWSNILNFNLTLK